MRHENIEGSLSATNGDVYPVRLNLTVARNGQPRVELKTRVPDGKYWLCYFYRRYRAKRVRVCRNYSSRLLLSCRKAD